MTNTTALLKAQQQLIKENQVYMMGNEGVMDGLAQSHAMRGIMGVVLLSTSANVLGAGLQKLQDTEQVQAPQGYAQQAEDKSTADKFGENVIDHGDGEYSIVAMKSAGPDYKNMDDISYAQQKLDQHETADSLFIIDNAKYQSYENFGADLNSDASFVKFDSQAIQQDLEAKFGQDIPQELLQGQAEFIAQHMEFAGQPMAGKYDKDYDQCTIFPLVEGASMEQYYSYAFDSSMNVKIPSEVSANFDKMVINEELAHCQDMIKNGAELDAIQAMGEKADLYHSVRLERYGQLKSAMEMVKDFGDFESVKMHNNYLKVRPFGKMKTENSIDHDMGDLYDQAIPKLEKMYESGELQAMDEAERDAWTLDMVHQSMDGLTPEILNAQQAKIDAVKLELEGMGAARIHEAINKMDIDPEIKEYVDRYNEGMEELHQQQNMEKSEVELSYESYLSEQMDIRDNDPEAVAHFLNKEMRALKAESRETRQMRSGVKIDMKENPDSKADLQDDLKEFSADRKDIRMKTSIVDSTYQKLMQSNPKLMQDDNLDLTVGLEIER